MATPTTTLGENAPLEIRPLTRADEPEWRKLWKAYLDFYETRVCEEVFRTSFERLLSSDENTFRGHLALWEGQPAGLVHYLFHPHMWRIEKVCYLQDLYVDPAFRRRGIAEALIETVKADARAHDVPIVGWLTQIENTRARRLYDRVAQNTGFIKYQTES